MYHSQPRSLFSHLSILITKGIPSDFSSYLDVGRRPKLKSDEKSEGIPLVVEIFLALRLKRLKKVYHLLGARPPPKEPGNFLLARKASPERFLGLTISLVRLICTAQARPEGLSAFGMSSPTH